LIKRYEHVCGDAGKKNGFLTSRLSMSLKVIQNDTYRWYGTYDFPSVIHGNYGPVSYHLEIIGDFGRKAPTFLLPRV